MKAFNKIFAVVIAVIIALFTAANMILLTDNNESGRPYLVEVSRLVREIEKDSFKINDLASCEFVTGVNKYGENFYNSHSDYVIREIGGELYRFDYNAQGDTDRRTLILTVNIILGIMAVMIIGVMLYIRLKILKPFEQLSDVPYELSKGNLTAPVKETKNRFFGRFIWGVDMLRENMEQQKERELCLQKEKKMLLLSLSHDIKTPLSAIKLYAKALSKGLYSDKQKQLQIAQSIDKKADEIESYVTQLTTASREDFLNLYVEKGEFYLSELLTKIKDYYSEKLSLIRTSFSVCAHGDCIISGDLDRSVEVMQNIIENAIKYGDGREIAVSCGEEDGCILVTVKNSGCTLLPEELPHIFESFQRGKNVGSEKGSGLGLFICRRLMRMMGGEAFARIEEGYMCVTAVFVKI